MNLLVDTTSFWKQYDNGKEQVIINLLKGWNELGFSKQISIICFKNRFLKFKTEIPNAKFIVIEDIYHQNGNRLQEMIDKISFFIFRNIRVCTIINNSDADLAFFASCGTPIRRFNIPTVVIPHDIQPISHKERYRFRTYLHNLIMLNLDFKLRDKIIAISDFDKDEIHKFFPQFSSKLVRIYNPIVLHSEIVPYNLRQGIISLNANGKHKNAITLLKAFNEIKDKITDNLIIAGNFNNRECLDYIYSNKLDDRIILTGYLSDTDLQNVFSHSRLYVSCTEFEGFGMTQVESIILGVPSIMPEVASLPEVTEGKGIYYGEPKDYIGLSKCILEQLDSKINTDELEINSRVLSDRYRYDRISQTYWSLFVEIAKKYKW